MSGWLGEQVRRGHLTWTMGEAARLWASDVMEAGRGVPVVNYGRSVAVAVQGADLMGTAPRRRLREVERRLGAPDSPTWRVAWWVAVEGRTAGEAAELLQVRTTTAMDLVRLALPVVAQVYGLRQDGPIRVA